MEKGLQFVGEEPTVLIFVYARIIFGIRGSPALDRVFGKSGGIFDQLQFPDSRHWFISLLVFPQLCFYVCETPGPLILPPGLQSQGLR